MLNAIKKNMNKLIIVLFIIFLGGLPYIIKNQYLMQTIIIILFYAYMGSCWNIIGGFAGQISLGHSVYAGIGAYVSTLLFIYLGISPFIGMLIGGLIAGVSSLIIGIPTFRLRGTYYTISTIAFLIVIRTIFLVNQKLFGLEIRAAQGITIPIKGNVLGLMQFQNKAPFYYIILIMVIIIILFTFYLDHSKMGYYFKAIKEDEEAASSLGVNTTRYKLIAGFISAFLTAIGGTFYVQLTTYVDPSTLLGNALSLQIALVTLLGGMGTIIGPIIGALVLTPISEALRALTGGQISGMHLVIYGSIMMIIVMFMPGGLIVAFKKILRLKEI